MRSFNRYLLAALSVGIAFWVTRALDFIISPPLSFPFYLLAVAFSAWSGGLWPGLLAMILGVILSRFIPASPDELYSGAEGLLRLTVFALVSLLITLLTESRRRSEQRLKVSLASIGDAVVTADSKGRIAFMNDAAVALTGWKLSDARRKRFTEVFRLKNEGDGVDLDSQLSAVLRNEKPASIARGARLAQKSGALVPVDDTMAPVIDASGHVSGAIVVFRDITESLELENARESARERAELLANALEIFAGSLNARSALASLCRLSVPILADWCGVWTTGESGKSELVSLRHRDSRMEKMVTSPQYQNETDQLLEEGVARLIRFGKPLFYSLNRPEQECKEHPELMRVFRELDLHSSIVVPLTSRRHTVGVLALGRTGRSREYDEADLSFAIDLGSRTAIFMENIRLVESLTRALREKELLLREVHHRVKNNLQVISSLLSLQSRSQQRSSGKEFFEDSNSRIRAMAQIHEMLMGSQDLSQIDFSEYVRRLAGELNQSFHAEERVSMRLDLQPCPLDISASVTLGLALNEIISNSFKHAFPGEARGAIHLRLQREKDGIAIEVGDDGVGVSNSDSGESENFGLRLVRLLVDQLGGTVQIESSPAGTSFHINLPQNDIQPATGDDPLAANTVSQFPASGD